MAKRLGVVLSLCLSAAAVPAHADDRTGATDLLAMFDQGCVKAHGQADATRRWAAAQNMTQLTHPEGLRLFAGGPEGAAWFTTAKSTPLVLALRASGVCAVFAERADPATLSAIYDVMIATLEWAGSSINRLPDQTQDTSHGVRTVRVALAGDKDRVTQTLMLMAEEKPGAPFQATLQTRFGPN